MAKYTVSVFITLKKDYTIEADNEEEAQESAESEAEYDDISTFEFDDLCSNVFADD